MRAVDSNEAKCHSGRVFQNTFFPHKIVIINVANIWWVPVIYLEQAHIYDAYMLQYMN